MFSNPKSILFATPPYPQIRYTRELDSAEVSFRKARQACGTRTESLAIHVMFLNPPGGARTDMLSCIYMGCI